MTKQTVLVVGDGDGDRAPIGPAQSGESVTVRYCPELASLYDELCLGEVDCLVLPVDVSGTDARDVVRGVRAFYPDLPVVVAGLSPADVPADLDVYAVETGTIAAAAVAVDVDGRFVTLLSAFPFRGTIETIGERGGEERAAPDVIELGWAPEWWTPGDLLPSNGSSLRGYPSPSL